MCTRIKSWAWRETQIFNYRSAGLADALLPPNASLYFVCVTRCEPVNRQVRARYRQFWNLHCSMIVTDTKEIKVAALCYLAWRRRMSRGLNQHEMPGNWQVAGSFSRITYAKSPSFCMTTFRASLTDLTVFLPQSRDSSLHVGRWIPASPPPWLQKHTDMSAHDFTHSPDLWHQPGLANLTCPSSWRLYGINPAIYSAALRYVYNTGDRWMKLKWGTLLGT